MPVDWLGDLSGPPVAGLAPAAGAGYGDIVEASTMLVSGRAETPAIGHATAQHGTSARPAQPAVVMRSAVSDELDPVGVELAARAQRGGMPLEATSRSHLEAALGTSLDAVRVHAGPDADVAARALGATAFTIDNNIFFRDGTYDPRGQDGKRLLAHEVAHTVQRRGAPTAMDNAVTVSEPSDAPEREATRFADDFVTHRHGDRQRAASRGPVLLQRAEPGVLRHPAEKVFKWTMKWLTKRGTKTVSKHIERHARRIAGRAIHSIFRHPKQIKPMIEDAVKAATELAAKHATRPAEEAIEEGAIKILRQATRTPGKVRWVVQKTFRDAIGTQGERVLRIIIDQSGRVVTAFPTDRLIAVGLSLGAIEILGEHAAEASGRARAQAERNAEREENSGSWWDFVPIIGDLWGGELNAGESEELRLRDEIHHDVASVIAAIEQEEKRKLKAEERELVEEMFLAGTGSPLLGESVEEDDSP